MARTNTTLILAHAHVVIRADFDGEQLDLVHKEQLPSTQDLARDVADLLSSGPSPGRDLWVLNGNCFSRVLSVPRVSVDGLSDEDLEAALGYEAELYSGLPATEGRVGVMALQAEGEEARFWLLHAADEELRGIESAAARHRCRFQGLLHPSGLARPLANESSGFWRVEVWPGLVLGIDSLGGATVLGDDPVRDRAAIESWWEEAGGRVEWLAGFDQPPPRDAEEVSVDEPHTQDALLCGWAEELQDAAGLLAPVIRPRAAKVDLGRRYRTAGLAAAVVLGMCAAHAWCMDQLTEESRADLKIVSKQEEERQRLYTSVEVAERGVEQKAEQLKTMREQRQDAETLRRAQRRRWAVLLNGLSRHRPQNLMVEDIRKQEDGVVVSGICLHPAEADDLAAQLERELEGMGWTVSAPTKRRAGANRGPFRFEFSLQEELPSAAQGDASRG